LVRVGRLGKIRKELARNENEWRKRLTNLRKDRKIYIGKSGLAVENLGKG